MDLKHELFKLELGVRESVNAILNDNKGNAVDRLVGVIDGLDKLQKQIGNDIVLSKEETINLLSPNREYLKTRDEYLKSINQTVTKNDDGSFTVDCPDLDLSNIIEK